MIASLVALRKESVDRNTEGVVQNTDGTMSLSARRAWIEISEATPKASRCSVALRKESVDRNYNVKNAVYDRDGRSPQGERG